MPATIYCSYGVLLTSINSCSPQLIFIQPPPTAAGSFGASKRSEKRHHSGRLEALFEVKSGAFGINTDTDLYTCFYRFSRVRVCAVLKTDLSNIENYR